MGGAEPHRAANLLLVKLGLALRVLGAGGFGLFGFLARLLGQLLLVLLLLLESAHENET